MRSEHKFTGIKITHGEKNNIKLTNDYFGTALIQSPKIFVLKTKKKNHIFV